jgi:hypothetical protein
MLDLRLLKVISLTFYPSILTSPENGSKNLTVRFSRVLFPIPDSPVITVKLPGSHLRSKFFRITLSPMLYETFINSSKPLVTYSSFAFGFSFTSFFWFRMKNISFISTIVSRKDKYMFPMLKSGSKLMLMIILMNIKSPIVEVPSNTPNNCSSKHKDRPVVVITFCPRFSLAKNAWLLSKLST